ncbi:hypothetical protein PC116_g21663 [Phytophthora cactorum]|nr:hypothetical protein PC116_g21663 [Phytophthora cactorum]
MGLCTAVPYLDAREYGHFDPGVESGEGNMVGADEPM